jgi:ATP-dependent protease HslVU (ClpYQ) peptidase subunit
MMGSTDFSSSDTTWKWRPVGDGFHAQLAGTISNARELTSQLHAQLLESKPEGVREVLETLRLGFGNYKHAFAEGYIQNRLGMSYANFLETGKESLPADLFRELSRDIADHDSEAQIIVSGFLNSRPVIFTVTGESVASCDDFAVIGSGSQLAEAALYHRDQSFMNGINRTIYCVYEAKRLAEKAPGVGRRTQMFVFRPDGSMAIIPDQGLRLLDTWFTRFGPQPIIPEVFPEEFLTRQPAPRQI